MTNYKAIDADKLQDELGIIATVCKESSLDESEIEEIDIALSKINSLIHGIDKQISIDERHDGSFEIIVKS